MKEQNFKFRESFVKLVEQMTDKQAGEFIKAVSGYVFAHKPMESKDEFLKGVFIYVKNVLDTEMRDRENGRIGGAIVAEKYKGKKEKGELEEEMITASSIISDLIILATGDGEVDKKGKHFNRCESKCYNPYGGGKYPNANKDDSKSV